MITIIYKGHNNNKTGDQSTDHPLLVGGSDTSVQPVALPPDGHATGGFSVRSTRENVQSISEFVDCQEKLHREAKCAQRDIAQAGSCNNKSSMDCKLVSHLAHEDDVICFLCGCK